MRTLRIALIHCLLAAVLVADERIDEVFKDVADDGPGGVCVVVLEGKVVHQGFYGLADIATRRRFNLDSAFDLASVSKQFTGLGLALLLEGGDVSVDDDVRTWLPELPVYDAHRPIRVGDLAHMVSGLPSYEDLLDEWRGKTGDDVLKAVAGVGKLEFPTGSRYVYSNTDYNVLSTLVARAAKARDFGAFAQDHLFGPLGLRQTAVLMRADQEISGRVTGYKGSAGNWTEDRDDTPAIVGDGSVFSTAGDLVRYEGAIRAGKVVTAAVLARWTTTGSASAGAGDYALGWEIVERDGYRVMQHNGAWNGTSTYLGLYSKPALTVIVLSNLAEAEAQEAGEAVAKIVLNEDH